MVDFQNIYPEIFLMLVMLLLLIAGVFIKNSFTLIKKGTILTLIICIPIIYINFDNQLLIFNNNYSINIFSNFIKIIILVASMFSLIFAGQYFKRTNIDKFEYPM